jgi:hypothetical protein
MFALSATNALVVNGTLRHFAASHRQWRYRTRRTNGGVWGRQHTQADLMDDPRRPSIRCGPVVPIAMAMREDVKANAELQGLLNHARMYPVSFGGQRYI